MEKIGNPEPSEGWLPLSELAGTVSGKQTNKQCAGWSKHGTKNTLLRGVQGDTFYVSKQNLNGIPKITGHFLYVCTLKIVCILAH